MAKRYIKKETLAGQLASLFVAYNNSTIPWSFAQVCDRRSLEHKEAIQWNQYMIELIDEVYKEFRELGLDAFIKKYGLTKYYKKNSTES